jgi:hypothetical protein
MYDDALSKKVLKIIMWAPLLYLAFGYWMASSMQLLENTHLTPIVTQSDVMPSSHTIGTVFTDFDTPGWFFLVILLIVLLLRCLPSSLVPGMFSIDDLVSRDEIVQKLENYWQALERKDTEWTVKEEENCR